MTYIGYILGHLGEFILFIYYANTSFYPRKSYLTSSLISLCGYIVLFGIGLCQNVSLSILAFFIVNTVLLLCAYNIKLKSAVFYGLILDVLSVIGEYVAVYLWGVSYSVVWEFIDSYQVLALFAVSKLIYFISIIVFKRFENTTYDNELQTMLAIIPCLTIVCLTIVMKKEIDSLLFLLICGVFLVFNIITFYTNTGFNEKNKVLRSLQEELLEYQLLSEKYENTKIMRHDFHKQLNVLKGLIAEDNVKAKEYMRQIQFSQRELDYVQYTDNKILNILLVQKIKECHEYGIEMHIHSSSPKMSFISDIDTVAIFSNLIDNAMEACMQSTEKEIYVDMYTVNNSYSAVKVENNADKEPFVIDGLLRTQKNRKDIHGIGVRSINNALKKYNSELDWSYDKENKLFTSMILIHIPE
ncbi:MAG: GHKL domain-containing protein [bacterium]|nr:GHKL domain-containing protein [bacterium]